MIALLVPFLLLVCVCCPLLFSVARVHPNSKLIAHFEPPVTQIDAKNVVVS